MRTVKRILQAMLAVFTFLALGALLALLRYMLKTPQTLTNDLRGEARIYKWTHGHIFYKVSGPPDAPPLLLLHAPAIGASSHEMRGIIQGLQELQGLEGLAQRYRVYAPDLPGFGLSDHLKIDYSVHTYVTFCQNFLQDVIGQPALVFASGLSCNYAVTLAASTTDLCHGLILISPVSLFIQAQPPPWLRYIAERTGPGLTLYACLTSRFVLRYVLAQQNALDYEHVSPADLDYSFAAAHQLGAHHAPLALLAGRLHPPTRQNLLAQLQQPILIIWGAHTPQATRANVTAIPPRARMVVVSDAHARVHEEYPDRVIAEILQWQRTEASPAPPEHISSPPTASNAPAATMPAIADPAAPVVAPAAPVETSTDTLDNAPQAATAEESGAQEAQIEAYCFKCRQKRIVQNARQIVTKNGRNAIEGLCPVCATRLFRFIRTGPA